MSGLRKRLAVALAAALLAFGPVAADAATKTARTTTHKAQTTHKPHYPKEGGHYQGSKGSSHKGGHYKNPRTHDHYTKHKK